MPGRESTVVRHGDKEGDVVLTLTLDVNLADLERNGVKAPQDWEFQDAEHAESLGLIYGYGVEVRDAR